MCMDVHTPGTSACMNLLDKFASIGTEHVPRLRDSHCIPCLKYTSSLSSLITSNIPGVLLVGIYFNVYA